MANGGLSPGQADACIKGENPESEFGGCEDGLARGRGGREGGRRGGERERAREREIGH